MTDEAGLLHRTVPARAGEPPHPGMLLIHGRGADEMDLLGLAPALDPRLFVVSVRAPFAWEIGYCWYETDSPAQHESMFRQALSLLGRFVENLPEAYPVDPSRFFALGFSQGSFMANALTLSAPQRVSGAVLLSGYQPPLEWLPTRESVTGKPFFVGHGTLDPLLGIERGRAVRDTLVGLEADVTYREYPIGHQISMPELEEIRSWLAQRLE